MKVFIIDDNPLHLKMCKVLLKNLGHDVSAVLSLDELKKGFGDIDEPDVALIDFRLSPGITGIDVLEFLKDRWPTCRFIVFTADVGERANLESSGFDKVVFKPVTEALLREILI